MFVIDISTYDMNCISFSQNKAAKISTESCTKLRKKAIFKTKGISVLLNLMKVLLPDNMLEVPQLLP